MGRQASRARLGVLAVLTLAATALLGGVRTATRADATVLRPGAPRPAPAVGVDLIYYASPPFVLINALNRPAEGDRAGAALRDLAGVSAVRFSAHGLWSPLGPRETIALRREVRLPNYFPWFPADRLAGWVVDQDFGVVLGVNPEEGPDAAVALLQAFERRGALGRIIAVELGNEPHLNQRPWLPEDYAEAAAAIVRALEPFGVRFAVPLTLGHETKTPTGISDDDYTRRQMAVFAERVALAGRDDIDGVVHLYARGVDPRTLDALSEIVRPFAPRMRYLVTEYNIRSTLADNQHLTTDYALEFMAKLGRLVARPDVAGLFVHGVPYHSLLYWSGRNVLTVSKYGDARLGSAEVTPGWHATPAGMLHGLFAKHLWRGDIVAFRDEGAVQGWIVRSPEGEPRAGLFNGTEGRVERRFDLGGREVDITLGPRSAAVASADGEIGRVELTRGW